MDFETFIQSLLSFVKNSNNLYFVLYSVATCLLTQITKKLFVNKFKVDVLHKFDFAVVLPFIFGLAFACIDAFVVRARPLCWDVISPIAIDTATIGALASVIFKFFSSISGGSLKSLLSNQTYAVFYTQLLYFGTAKEQMEKGELSFKDFVSQVKLLATNAKAIYNQTELSADEKRSRLATLLNGIVDATSLNTCVNALNEALIRSIKTE